MPKCKICGKELKNPNDPRHIRSKYHQEKLKKLKLPVKEQVKVRGSPDYLTLQNIMREISDIKENILNLEIRLNKIENIIKEKTLTNDFNLKSQLTLIELNDKDLMEELNSIINQRKNYKQIKKSISLKELKDIFNKRFNFTEKQFREVILRLYRKQLIDLQPGGLPNDYHLLSPTGKKFYFLILKS